MPEPVLSVVVIGRNEGARLTRCLESVRAMASPGPIEIIYVDSCSSDDSTVRAATLGARVVEIKGGRVSAARARNAGWQVASSPVILFLDGDTILHRDFVIKALPAFEDAQVKVVWGHRRETHPETSVYNRVSDLDWYLPPGLTEFCGGDALMRRATLEEAGGFNPDLIAGEEPDLCRRIRSAGGLISHIDVPMTGHDLALVSWRQYWRRAFRAGHAYAEIARLYKNSGDPLWTGASRGNVVKACIYILCPVVAIAAAFLMHSWSIVLLALLCLLAIILRTAIKVRARSTSAVTLFLFAVHSHFQQLPVFHGQLSYWWNAKKKWRSELIEYKKPL